MTKHTVLKWRKCRKVNTSKSTMTPIATGTNMAAIFELEVEAVVDKEEIGRTVGLVVVVTVDVAVVVVVEVTVVNVAVVEVPVAVVVV